MRILDDRAVARLLTPAMALDCIKRLYTLAADPGATGLARTELHHPRGWLRALPGFIGPEHVFGFKVLNRTAESGMRYVIYVYDLDSGTLVGLVDGNLVTHLRTGSVSALATDLMAPATVQRAAIIGAGRVAWGQAVALDLVRPAVELRVYSPTTARREAFVTELATQLSGEVKAAGSLEAALDGAELVTLATASNEPFLETRHLRPGVHVNSVGPATRPKHEIHPAAFAGFDRIVCDSVELVFQEAGDALAAVAAGTVAPDTAYDLASVVAGKVPARKSESEITLFKSVGNGLQDLIVARKLLTEASLDGIGTVVDDFTSLKPN